MRPILLLVLTVGLAAGCSSTRYDRSARSYPASARVSSANGQARYVICHKGKKTLTLPASAVAAHRKHGDRFGDCSRRDARERRATQRRKGRRN